MPDGGDKRRPVRIIIAGGGTGGHLYPGLALAKELKTKWNAEILFIGTAYGIENKILPTMPYKFKKIWIRGLQRKLSLSNLVFPLRLVISLLQCAVIFLAFRPGVVIGCGGYASGPPLMMGWMMRIPTVIQEQNSYPGLVNRLLGNRVEQIHVTFEDSIKFFAKQSHLHVSGNPVTGGFGTVEKKTALAEFGLQPDKITLLVFGGSQGARAINNAVLQSLDMLQKKTPNLQFLWATGPAEFEYIKQALSDNYQNVVLRPYIDKMALAYAAADLVICRAGATTLAEIAICKVPAILIPYPFAAENHQLHNAKSMRESGAAFIIEEDELTPEALSGKVTELVSNADERNAMSQASGKFARPHAARDIANAIIELISS